MVTWTGSASDSATWSTVPLAPIGSYREHRVSHLVRGSAIVHLSADGHRIDSQRLMTASDSYVYDMKDHETWQCGDLVSRHDHRAVLFTAEAPKEPLPNLFPPEMRSDGSWIIRNAYPEWEDTCLVTSHYADCNGLDRDEMDKKTCNPFSYIVHAAPSGTFDLEATAPDFFSKKISYEISDPELWWGSHISNLKVEWKITARRIGKCLVSVAIPLDGKDPGINDEDIEMGVEHGSAILDPDNGVAALNIRVTCDQVPIKNAEVDVKVEVQKNTGGHTHRPAGRPRGSLQWNGVETKLTDAKPSIRVKTDDDGRVHLSFKPGKAVSCPPQGNTNCPTIGIAGIYRIDAASVRFPLRTAEVAVEAKVGGLSSIVADANLVDDVRAGAHTSGDNATAATKERLTNFGSAFREAQKAHNDELAACQAHPWHEYPLWAIDVSLPFGGLYDDIHDDWATPHQTHGRGDGVDFSVFSSPPKDRRSNAETSWPDADVTSPVCEGYRVSPQGWLMVTMMRVGNDYGHWDQWDLCHDYQAAHPTCANEPTWHLHVNQK
jgi:hypothetical protein